MDNLDYLTKFMEETYGAICFRNCKEDGWSGSKDFEVLTIFFPNKHDLNVKQIAKRLIKACGEDFYKKCCIKDMSLSPIYNSIVVIKATIDGQDYYDMSYSYGPSYYLVVHEVEYFMGQLNPNCIFGSQFRCEEVVGNNGFVIRKGEFVKKCMDDYLRANNISLIKQKYERLNPYASREIIAKHFSKELRRVYKIKMERDEEFSKSLRLVTQENWDQIKKLLGADKELPPSEFDD